jgi:hypothetical protein
MAELPLLLFPSPRPADRTKRKTPITPPRMPSAVRQGERLSPVFKQLQSSFNARCAELQQTPSGIDPEQVLVIETIGNIENFASAVKRIPGLEWMGEIEAEEIAPDEDFYFEKTPEKELSGRLYLVMSNQTALMQMLALWSRYQADTSMTFQHGLTKFRDVFLHLKDIRRWGVEDRLAEREIFEAWKDDLEGDYGQRTVKFEAELWFRESHEKRMKSQSLVAQLIQELGGNVISQCMISSIAYHSILGEIPARVALEILERPEVDLIKCENIMVFRPTGQMATGKGPIEGDISDCSSPPGNLPSGDPIIAVFDGLPLENHNLLSGRLIVDDPDGWSSEYPAIDRQHGTAMTSLIALGDLNENPELLSRPLYVRPIMKPNPSDPNSPRSECVPEEILVVDYIHRAVKRIMEGEGDDAAVAPSVRIINLSIGDRFRHFSQIMSPLARLLDWLSVEHNLLFVISSGNHGEPIETGISSRDFEGLTNSEREGRVVRKLYEDARHRKLLSPAESINGLTVGAIHHDFSNVGSIGHLVDVFESSLPSPVSAFGSGYRRSIKPDLLFHGGRVLYSQSLGSGNSSLELRPRRSAPGNKVAAPSFHSGELNKSQFCCGSSNSAALISRAGSICYDYLDTIFSEQSTYHDFATYSIPLLKAMLVHGCSWNDMGVRLNDLLKTSAKNNSQLKKWISSWVGYGVPDIQKVLGCNEQRATLLGFGQLNDEEAHAYSLPLPPSLNAQREWRRLTVTLAWLSPVSSNTQRYRNAQLWFDFEDGKQSRVKLSGKLSVSGIDSDSYSTRRGTVQHEIFEGENAVAILDGDTLQIKVNCRKDAHKIINPVAYGLVVSLEVAEGIDLPIYNEIREKVVNPIGVRAGS